MRKMGGEYRDQYQEGVNDEWQRCESRRKSEREEAQYAAACAAARTNKGAQPSEVAEPFDAKAEEERSGEDID